MRNKISIIIVNWNTKDDTRRCIESIYRNCTLKFEIIVIDNNSQDNSYAHLKERFPKIRLVQNKKNLGYAKANNLGFKLAKYDFVIVLNPDTQIQKGTFESLVKFYKNNPHVGAVVPKLLNPNGSTQYYYHRKLPTLKYQIASLIYNYTPFKKFRWSQEFFLLDQKFESDTLIEQAAGVCILTTKSVLKKIGGLFDPKLPIFLNDVDFSFRIKKHGFSIFLAADSKLIHYRSSSTSKLDPYTLRQEVILSILHYLKKNSGFLSYATAKGFILILLAIVFVLNLTGLSKNYLMVRITNRRESFAKQWKNLTATITERRNHPGLRVYGS